MLHGGKRKIYAEVGEFLLQALHGHGIRFALAMTPVQCQGRRASVSASLAGALEFIFFGIALAE